MNISYPCGSWPMKIENVDVNKLTDEQIQFIGHAIVKHGVVIIKQQNLSIDDEIAFGKRFGELNPYSKKNVGGMDDEAYEKFYRANHRESEYIDSVTGKLNEEGLPGLHGMKEELNWHCGQAWSPKRTDVVYLYGVEGTKSSQTIYMNSVMSYADLRSEWKDKIANYTLRATRGYNRYSKTGETFNVPDVETQGYRPPMVRVNQIGEKALYFPFYQVVGIHDFAGTAEEEQEIMDYLQQHMSQEKYTYTHDWDDGDLIVWDNWNGLHKRPAFDDMENRLLHRMQFNLDHIKF